jgi:hypothetical protein
MRLWWWRKVRKSNIPSAERDLFERYGEAVIGAVLAGGYTRAGRSSYRSIGAATRFRTTHGTG